VHAEGGAGGMTAQLSLLAGGGALIRLGGGEACTKVNNQSPAVIYIYMNILLWKTRIYQDGLRTNAGKGIESEGTVSRSLHGMFGAGLWTRLRCGETTFCCTIPRSFCNTAFLRHF
jgi:hypothetical protein